MHVEQEVHTVRLFSDPCMLWPSHITMIVPPGLFLYIQLYHILKCIVLIGRDTPLQYAINCALEDNDNDPSYILETLEDDLTLTFLRTTLTSQKIF